MIWWNSNWVYNIKNVISGLGFKYEVNNWNIALDNEDNRTKNFHQHKHIENQNIK